MQCEGVVKILRVPINCRSFFFFVFILLVIHLSIIIIIIIILTCEQKKKEKKRGRRRSFLSFRNKTMDSINPRKKAISSIEVQFDERKFTISKEGWFKIKILKINKFTHSFHTFPPYLAHFFNRKRNTKKYTHGER